MRIKLINSSHRSADMEKHYQKLISEGWGGLVSKETRTIKGFTPAWDIEETNYELFVGSEIESRFLFDLSELLGEELILRKEDGQPVIEIYDDWRE